MLRKKNITGVTAALKVMNFSVFVMKGSEEEADRETDDPLSGLAERLLMHYGNKVTNSEVISPELQQ